ncbi:MAG: DUF86 domain-containing protein [Chloroflexi bacterium]|nr:DUF86 domain-containing protein [Chloroflexota bacterium]
MRGDEARLLDMLIACRKIIKFTHDLTRDTFENNDLVQSAVIREFQVLGEAARLISDDTRTTYDQIPWHLIAGMRNRLIHEYFSIQVDIVWVSIQDDIPPLLELLETILNSDGASTDTPD